VTEFSAYQVLSGRLCPWLRAPLENLETAHAKGLLAHGWILAGPRGVGKINLALAFAHRLLKPGGEALADLGAGDGAAAMAQRHEAMDHHPDLHWRFPEPEKRTLTVDQIRETPRALTLTSLEGPAKVVILEPAEAMTPGAANALLKTLEEPTPRTYLFLVAHQPGRLQATIRSRCQWLAIPRPTEEEALGWLTEAESTESESDWQKLLALAGGAPFRAIALSGSEYLQKNKEFEEQFNLISRSKLDPQVVADAWKKDDLDLALGWLATRLQGVIRARMAPEAWNPITDLGPNTLHNAWQTMSLRTLFRLLQSTEALLQRLGGGINADLATRALLLGFQT